MKKILAVTLSINLLLVNALPSLAKAPRGLKGKISASKVNVSLLKSARFSKTQYKSDDLTRVLSGRPTSSSIQTLQMKTRIISGISPAPLDKRISSMAILGLVGNKQRDASSLFKNAKEYIGTDREAAVMAVATRALLALKDYEGVKALSEQSTVQVGNFWEQMSEYCQALELPVEIATKERKVVNTEDLDLADKALINLVDPNIWNTARYVNARRELEKSVAKATPKISPAAKQAKPAAEEVTPMTDAEIEAQFKEKQAKLEEAKAQVRMAKLQETKTQIKENNDRWTENSLLLAFYENRLKELQHTKTNLKKLQQVNSQLKELQQTNDSKASSSDTQLQAQLKETEAKITKTEARLKELHEEESQLKESYAKLLDIQAELDGTKSELFNQWLKKTDMSWERYKQLKASLSPSRPSMNWEEVKTKAPNFPLLPLAASNLEGLTPSQVLDYKIDYLKMLEIRNKTELKDTKAKIEEAENRLDELEKSKLSLQSSKAKEDIQAQINKTELQLVNLKVVEIELENIQKARLSLRKDLESQREAPWYQLETKQAQLLDAKTNLEALKKAKAEGRLRGADAEAKVEQAEAQLKEIEANLKDESIEKADRRKAIAMMLLGAGAALFGFVGGGSGWLPASLGAFITVGGVFGLIKAWISLEE